MEEQDVVTMAEAQTQTGASRATLYRLMEKGAVTPRKVRGDQRTYVSLSEVRAALAALPPARRRPKRWREGE